MAQVQNLKFVVSQRFYNEMVKAGLSVRGFVVSKPLQKTCTRTVWGAPIKECTA